MLKRIFFLMMFTTQCISSVFSPEDINRLKQNFFANIHSNGAIVASPSQQDPDYYYDWVRDSALAMGLIENWYEATHADQYKKYLFHYVSWTENIQHQYEPIPGQDILGEPKFYINGYPFDGPWGRPQNDGPALRALVLTRFAQQLLDTHDTHYVQQHLYNKSMDPQTMGTIKMDLEYTAHHWRDANFDLWEEVFGHHFFTTMAQHKALTEGIILARRLNDEKAAAFYETQAHLIAEQLTQYINHDQQLIGATLAPHPGPQKTNELDCAVILAILNHPQTEGYFAPDHPFVKNTVNALHEQFNLMFPINNNHSGAILFGRYPGDTYDGHRTDTKGNPWFILTATMAEYYFTQANHLVAHQKNKRLVTRYMQLGDNYLKLIKKYAPEMTLSEQINLKNGQQQGAISLTWSYVSVLKALDLRSKVQKQLNIISSR